MARKRRSTTELNTAENASVPKRRYGSVKHNSINTILVINIKQSILFFSSQRTPFDEMVAFSSKRCLTWFNKYTTNRPNDTLGNYKRRF